MHVGLLVSLSKSICFLLFICFLKLVRFRMFFSDMQLLDAVSVMAV